MTLIVEDGSGLPNAESYVSVADTDTRLGALGLTIWDDLVPVEKEQALRRATQYMLQAYRNRWRGKRVHAAQALDWPRAGVCIDGFMVDSATVPLDVANACADLAFKAAAGDLNEDIDREIVREKAGPLEVEYAPHSRQWKRYRSIDMALAPYLTGSSVLVPLIVA